VQTVLGEDPLGGHLSCFRGVAGKWRCAVVERRMVLPVQIEGGSRASLWPQASSGTTVDVSRPQLSMLWEGSMAAA